MKVLGRGKAVAGSSCIRLWVKVKIQKPARLNRRVKNLPDWTGGYNVRIPPPDFLFPTPYSRLPTEFILLLYTFHPTAC